MFDLEQAAAFFRAIAGQTEPLSTMQALTALDHAERLDAEIARQRAQTISTDRCLIDPYRCGLPGHRHVLSDGSVA